MNEEEEPGDKEGAQVGTESGVAEEERVLWGFRSLNPCGFECVWSNVCVRERERSEKCSERVQRSRVGQEISKTKKETVRRYSQCSERYALHIHYLPLGFWVLGSDHSD